MFFQCRITIFLVICSCKKQNKSNFIDWRYNSIANSDCFRVYTYLMNYWGTQNFLFQLLYYILKLIHFICCSPFWALRTSIDSYQSTFSLKMTDSSIVLIRLSPACLRSTQKWSIYLQFFHLPSQVLWTISARNEETVTEDWLRTVRKSPQKETVLAGGNERVGKVGGVGGRRYVHDRSFGKSLLQSGVFLTLLHKQSLD